MRNFSYVCTDPQPQPADIRRADAISDPSTAGISVRASKACAAAGRTASAGCHPAKFHVDLDEASDMISGIC
ncbi:hypothetical protein [Mesorhizobium sp. M1322]|uniref:hypothetical protein n=1 Tax=Mesorhizobium sp. M1322 TaxID=2957081 RepID=UPI0033364A56